jgi:hypothetical protein
MLEKNQIENLETPVEYVDLPTIKKIFRIIPLKQSFSILRYPIGRYSLLHFEIPPNMQKKTLKDMRHLYKSIKKALSLRFNGLGRNSQIDITLLFIEEIFPVISNELTRKTEGIALHYYKTAMRISILDYIFKKYPSVLEATINISDEDLSLFCIITYAKEIDRLNKEEIQRSTEFIVTCKKQSFEIICICRNMIHKILNKL